jgi:hypothetical protein
MKSQLPAVAQIVFSSPQFPDRHAAGQQGSTGMGLHAVAMRGWVGLMAAIALAAPVVASPLTIDDVLHLVSIDSVALSPDGGDIAVVIQRPVGKGEVAGRMSYEIDPSRTDVWLVPRAGGGKRNLTQGRETGAGFWCAQWSPDGDYLAMLSTKPEGAEPHGGDAVRLYTWRRADGALTRLSQRPMLTQTRYGSPLNAIDMRGGADGGTAAKVCRRNEENAPFLWLDDRHLLAVQMPEGETSALFDQFRRPAEQVARTTKALGAGQEPTVDVSDPEPMLPFRRRVPIPPRSSSSTSRRDHADSSPGCRIILSPACSRWWSRPIAGRWRCSRLSPSSRRPNWGRPPPTIWKRPSKSGSAWFLSTAACRCAGCPCRRRRVSRSTCSIGPRTAHR